jgi:hypothetical protein
MIKITKLIKKTLMQVHAGPVMFGNGKSGKEDSA